MSTTPAEWETRTAETDAEKGWHVDDRCLNCNIARQLAPPGMIGYTEGGQ
ncbi:hypothetical protein [Streptomyces niveus]